MFPRRLYAHRGASAEAPENTLVAFRRALELGAHALETDAHLTRDGHIVLSHDASARRMTGTPAAWKDLDLAEARRLDAGWGFVARDGSRPFAGRGVTVPTLEEVLVELPGVVVNVDLKQRWPPLAERVVSLLRRLGAEERVILASFSWLTLRAVRARGFRGDTALTPQEVAALLVWPNAPLGGTCAQIPVRAGPVSLTTPRFIATCHARRRRVDYWTVNDPVAGRALLDAGADGLMTDDPGALAHLFLEKLAIS